VTHTDRLRAAVSGAGVADLRLQYSISDARRWRFDYFRGSPFSGHEELYARQSPVTYARQARVPTLFIHGEKDERCPPAQGLMMYRALRDNGVEAEMVLYPREPHVFVEPRHLVDRARRVLEWFRAHDRPDRVGRSFDIYSVNSSRDELPAAPTTASLGLSACSIEGPQK